MRGAGEVKIILLKQFDEVVGHLVTGDELHVGMNAVFFKFRLL
jgi:hypothetical protein